MAAPELGIVSTTILDEVVCQMLVKVEADEKATRILAQLAVSENMSRRMILNRLNAARQAAGLPTRIRSRSQHQ